jgi:hypothetical protein
MPFVTEQTVLLADNQFMTPLLLQIQLKALRNFKWDVKFDTLFEYPSEPTELIDRIDDLKQRADHNSQILFLLSVNSSGKTAYQVKYYNPKSTVIVLCDTREMQTKVVDTRFVIVPMKRWKIDEHGECPACKEDLNLIYIDRETLEPKPQNTEIENKRPDLRRAKSKKKFWEAASKSRAVRLCVDIKYGESKLNQTRHHSIYIDTRRLSEEPKFHKLCIIKLWSLPRPDLVVIPQHENSDIVANLLKEALQFNVPRLIRPIISGFGKILEIFRAEPPPIHIVSLSDLGALLDKYRTVKRILVADDGIVTGLTVRTFKDVIFHFYRPSGEIPDLDCFVMVARPPNNIAKESAEFPFRAEDGKHFIYGELVYLPYGGDRCPWCRELKLLLEYRHKLPSQARDAIEKRIAHLEGEVEFPLIVSNPSSYLTLKSFFGNLSPKAAFAAMAYVTQTLMNEMEEKHDPYKVPAVDLAFVVRAYFEAVFPASFLRTLDKKYCRVEEHEKKITDFLETYVTTHSSPGLVAELAWSAIQGKIPSKPILDIIKKMPDKNDPVIEMLLYIMNETCLHNDSEVLNK